MSTWFAVARPALMVAPMPGTSHHLGLGCDWWPRFENDAACIDAVTAAIDWREFDTLVGREWQPVMGKKHVAERFFNAAARELKTLSLLRLSLTDQPNASGWDIGPAGGGHSTAMHEPGLNEFFEYDIRLNAFGLFPCREDAERFLNVRKTIAKTHPLEQCGAWSIVCVAAIESNLETHEARGEQAHGAAPDILGSG